MKQEESQLKVNINADSKKRKFPSELESSLSTKPPATSRNLFSKEECGVCGQPLTKIPRTNGKLFGTGSDLSIQSQTEGFNKGPSHRGLSPPGTISPLCPSDKKTDSFAGASFFSPFVQERGALLETSVNSTGAEATSKAPSMISQPLIAARTNPSTIEGGAPALSSFQKNKSSYVFGEQSFNTNLRKYSRRRKVQRPARSLPDSIRLRLLSPGLNTGKEYTLEWLPYSAPVQKPPSSLEPAPLKQEEDNAANKTAVGTANREAEVKNKVPTAQTRPAKYSKTKVKSLQKKSGWKAGTLFSALFVLASLIAIIMFLSSSSCSNLIARTKQYFGKCYLSSDGFPALQPSDSCQNPLHCPLNGNCRNGKLINCEKPFDLTEEETCVLPEDQALAHTNMALNVSDHCETSSKPNSPAPGDLNLTDTIDPPAPSMKYDAATDGSPVYRTDTIDPPAPSMKYDAATDGSPVYRTDTIDPPASSMKYDAATDGCPVYSAQEETEQRIKRVFIEEMYERNQGLISQQTSYALSLPKVLSSSFQLFLRENIQEIHKDPRVKHQ